MTDEEKTKNAQHVYDSVMNAFPDIRRFMEQAQNYAKKHGYVETILGRRRHLPDMTLDEFEFDPLPGYVNPNIDPLDLSTLEVESGIPQNTKDSLLKEFSKLKYFGQIMKKTKELHENEHIKVINNRPKINDARRQCVNCVDSETEILTTDGWKRYEELKAHESIIAYSLESRKLVVDTVLDFHEQRGEDIEVWSLSNSKFNAICTENHRWVMENFDTKSIKIYDTAHILRTKRPRYHILRVADNDINPSGIEDFSAMVVSVNLRNNHISYEDLYRLSQSQALEVYDYFKDNVADHGCVTFEEEVCADKFQVLALLAGKCVNKRKVVKERKRKESTVCWKVSCSKKDLCKTARIDLMTRKKTTTNFVWCVTTQTGTWIARRDGKYYITGNSIIQGSAADFTKSALLKVVNDPKWKEVGGQVLTVVHDEIVAQVPADRWEAGAEVLKYDMESSGDFLPFPIKCDVTATYRWYGLELPCKFSKPTSLDLDDENTCSWVQWHLVELGYALPIFKDADGNSPIGDAAHGVSGKRSQELDEAIRTYCNRYHIDQNDFIDDIEQRVEVGIQ